MSLTTATQLSQPELPEYFDEDGFLVDDALWTREFARQTAEFMGIGPLSFQHWIIIENLRERFLRVGGVPVMRLVCRETGFSRLEIIELFGSCAATWKVAGLPNPGEEFKAYT